MPSKTGILADYYSRQELAEELDKTVRTLARWAWLRTGPRQTKLGGRVYYHRSDVEAWLAGKSEQAK